MTPTPTRPPCGICRRDPARANSATSECSFAECPHRPRAWSDAPQVQRWHEDGPVRPRFEEADGH